MSPIRSISVRNKNSGEGVQFPVAGQKPSFAVAPKAALTVHVALKEGAVEPKLQLKKVGHDLVLVSEHDEVLVFTDFYLAPSASLEALSFVTAAGGSIDPLASDNLDVITASNSSSASEGAAVAMASPLLGPLAGLAALLGAGAGAGAGAGIGDGGNAGIDDDAAAAGGHPEQAVASVDYRVSVALGPLIDGGVGAKVVFYRADTGAPLGETAQFEDGQFVFTDRSGYRGHLLVKMVDADRDPDYLDEATNHASHIESELWLSTQIAANDQTVKLTLSPLSTLAVMKALALPAGDDVLTQLLRAAPEAADFEAANRAVASVFLGSSVDLARQSVVFAVTPLGAPMQPNAYGKALAVISTLEMQVGLSTLSVLELLMQSLRSDGANASMDTGLGAVWLRNAALEPSAAGQKLSASTPLVLATEAMASVQRTTSNLDPSALAKLNPAEIHSHSAAWVSGLHAELLAVLTPLQVNALGLHIRALSPSALSGLSKAVFSRLEPAQLAALTAPQVAHLSAQQVNALTAQQLLSLQHSLAHLPSLTPHDSLVFSINGIAEVADQGLAKTLELTLYFDRPMYGLTSGSTNQVLHVNGQALNASWKGQDNSHSRTLSTLLKPGLEGQVQVNTQALQSLLTASTLRDSHDFGLAFVATAGVIPEVTNGPVIDTQAPSAPTLVLGAGVGDGATMAEATATGGVLTVTAESGASTVVRFTRSGGGSLSKTLTGTGAAQAVVLSADDLLSLGDGTVN
ncbi:hypothetical protein, partial [Limnohabitans sp.]|uniref:hypothetical protein n=1 Tax=Limnohabitans sp. TaxID=1907725 RepID=UPI0037BFD9AE